MSLSKLLTGGVSLDSNSSHFGLMIFRVFSGFGLIYAHGWGKLPPTQNLINGVGEMGLPFPVLFAWLAAFAEFFGAILLALGLFTRPVAFVLIGNMAVVVLLAHAGDSFRDREKALLYFFGAVMFFLTGPGRYSLDAWLRRRA